MMMGDMIVDFPPITHWMPEKMRTNVERSGRLGLTLFLKSHIAFIIRGSSNL